MIKAICRNFSVFILLISIGIIAYKIGQWRMFRPKATPETVFITDTLDYEQPSYVKRPGLTFRLFHKSIPPRSVQPVMYKAWMDSVYAAVSTVVKNGTMEIIGKRGKNAHKYTYDDVPPDHEVHGTEIGFNIIRHRFKNPFGWNGILIGSKFYGIFEDINPYVETGIRIKSIIVNVGIDKYSVKEKIPIYIDINYRAWL